MNDFTKNLNALIHYKYIKAFSVKSFTNYATKSRHFKKFAITKTCSLFL